MSCREGCPRKPACAESNECVPQCAKKPKQCPCHSGPSYMSMVIGAASSVFQGIGYVAESFVSWSPPEPCPSIPSCPPPRPSCPPPAPPPCPTSSCKPRPCPPPKPLPCQCPPPRPPPCPCPPPKPCPCPPPKPLPCPCPPPKPLPAIVTEPDPPPNCPCPPPRPLPSIVTEPDRDEPQQRRRRPRRCRPHPVARPLKSCCKRE